MNYEVRQALTIPPEAPYWVVVAYNEPLNPAPILNVDYRVMEGFADRALADEYCRALNDGHEVIVHVHTETNKTVRKEIEVRKRIAEEDPAAPTDETESP